MKNYLVVKKSSVKVAVLALFAFLFSGLGATSVFPVLIASLAYSHPVFITGNPHKLQLILHHPGNHDAHEAQEKVGHRHDLLDVLIGVSVNQPATHTDHTVELPSLEKELPTSPKNFAAFKTLPLMANASIVSASGRQSLEHRLPSLFTGNNPHSEFSRSTILVI